MIRYFTLAATHLQIQSQFRVNFPKLQYRPTEAPLSSHHNSVSPDPFATRTGVREAQSGSISPPPIPYAVSDTPNHLYEALWAPKGPSRVQCETAPKGPSARKVGHSTQPVHIREGWVGVSDGDADE